MTKLAVTQMYALRHDDGDFYVRDSGTWKYQSGGGPDWTPVFVPEQNVFWSYEAAEDRRDKLSEGGYHVNILSMFVTFEVAE